MTRTHLFLNLVNSIYFLTSAKAAGVVIMNEIGVDPGVDHLYALKTINEVHAEGGKVCHVDISSSPVCGQVFLYIETNLYSSHYTI